MIRYIGNRIWSGVVTLFLVWFLIWAILEVLPGDIISTLIADEAYTPEEAALVERQLGLDRPLPERYVTWLKRIFLHGDFGESIRTKQSVVDTLKQALPITIELGLLSLLLASVAGIFLGTYSGVRQNKPDDHAARVISIVGISVPSFYLGTLAIVFPAIWWGWTPPLFYVKLWEDPLANLNYLLLPSVLLALAPAATLARITRSAVLETLRQDYVRTGRAKGLPTLYLMRNYVLRNAFCPY